MADYTIYLTLEGRKELEKELEKLQKEKIPEIAQRIKEAKELGDLSENAEYLSAKEDQGFVAGRILEIQSVLSNAQVVSNPTQCKTVQVGATIVVKKKGSHAENEYVIVGSAEAKPLEGKISNESPLGNAFLGTKVGDEITVDVPAGKMTFIINEIK